MDSGEGWLTVGEAADRLGISKEALRKRIRRGSVQAERREDGTWRVQLPDGQDGGEAGRGDVVAELRAHNATLREQLEAERQAHAEARRIIAGLVERLPSALEAPQEESPPEPPGAPESAAAGSARGDVPQEQERAGERPWWRRVFGG
jgi:excisionase family DNA binding protein